MGRPSKKVTSQRYIEAAKRVLSRDSNPDIRLIAEEAGVRTPSLYNFFSSRNVLLTKAYRDLLEDILSLLTRPEPQPEQTSEITLRTKMLCTFCSTHITARELLMFPAAHPALKNEQYRTIEHRVHDRILRLIADYYTISPYHEHCTRGFFLFRTTMYTMLSSGHDPQTVSDCLLALLDAIG